MKKVTNTVKEERKSPKNKKKGRKANWNGHFLRKNRLLKNVIEGRMEGMKELWEDEN